MEWLLIPYILVGLIFSYMLYDQEFRDYGNAFILFIAILFWPMGLGIIAFMFAGEGLLNFYAWLDKKLGRA